MKRLPRKGEAELVHGTVGTGDIQRFAICDENFNPQIVERMREMLTNPLMGYRLEPYTAEGDKASGVVTRFYVNREDHTRLTENVVRRFGSNVSLETTLLTGDMPPEEALMLADLEQCAALMLAYGSSSGHQGQPGLPS